MNILSCHAYYNPELTADTHLENELIKALIDAGHELFVLCPSPTRGIDRITIQKYRKIKREELYGGKLHIRRYWAPQERKNCVMRALRYFWCTLREYMIAGSYKEINAIYSNSTPPIQGYICGKIRKKLIKKNKNRHNVKYVFSLQDIFPDTLVAAGLAKKKSVLWKIGRLIENRTYKNADNIIVIGPNEMDNIIQKGVSENKISMIQNWIDTSCIRYISRSDNRLFEELNLEIDARYVVYAGNLGIAQNISLLIDVAKKLQTCSDIQFLIFGSGGQEEELKKKISEEHIENVKIFPLLPLDRIAEVYSIGDIDIVMCKKGFGNSAIPSKTYSIMACGRPIIASFDKDSYLCRLISSLDCGMIAEPDSIDSLANTILDFFALDEQQQSSLGVNARAYVENNCDVKECTRKYVEIFEA